MRVLYLTNIPSPYRIDFFNELGKECDLTVLFERKSASDRDERWKSDEAKNYKEVYLNGIKIKSDSSICFDIIKWIDKKKFDVFVVGGYSTPTGMLAIQLLKIKKIPFILNTDGGFIKNDKKIIYLIKKYFISSATWWLSTGKLTSEYLEYYGANKKNIFIYPFTSIKSKEIINRPLTFEEKSILRKELNIESEYIALSVGQFIQRKGYDLLINSWKNVDSRWKLIIIGSGPKEEELKNLVDRNNLNNVNIIDFKQKEELFKYYLASDLFILPTREDIWGLVVNEAISCGIGVISSDKCVAALEIIKNKENGYILNLNELDKISSLINKFSYEDLNAMGLNNIEVSKRYTIEMMAKRHLEIFNMIIKDK